MVSRSVVLPFGGGIGGEIGERIEHDPDHARPRLHAKRRVPVPSFVQYDPTSLGLKYVSRPPFESTEVVSYGLDQCERVRY